MISVYDGIRSHWQELEENTYLHSIKDNYQYAESINPYHHVINNIQDELWDTVIVAQEKREKELLNLLLGQGNYNTIEDGAAKISEWVFQYGGVNDIIEEDTVYLHKYIGTILTQALERTNMDRNAQASPEMLEPLYDEVEQLLCENMKKYRTTMEQEIAKYASNEGIGLEMAKKMRRVLERYGSKTGTIFNQSLEDYIKEISNSNALSDFKGAALEEAITYSVGYVVDVLQQLKDVEVVSTGEVRVKGKAGKADNLIMTTGQINIPYGISDKTTRITASTGGARIKLNDESSLQTFLKNLQSMHVFQNSAGTKKMQQLGYALDNNNLKYHLINQTFFNKGDIKKTEPYDDIVSAIKSSIFLFIGGQFLKYADSINVDFMNINGHFVPVSSIMKGLDGQKQKIKAKVNPGLDYKEVKLDEDYILGVKKKTPIRTANDFYSNTTIDIGHTSGQKIWKAIYLKRIVLSLKIKELI